MSVTTDLSFFTGATGGSSDCDSITDWEVSPTLDTEIFIQGTGSLSLKVSKTTVTSVLTLAASVNLTGKSLFCWAYILEIGILATKANKGFGLRVEDGAGNWGEWNIAGKDTWGGQWKCFAQDVDTTFTSQSATAPDRTAITKVGVFFTTTATPKAYPNVFWDALRYGTYLRAYGGTEASPVDFDAILSAEDQVANKWGILERSEGIIMSQGNLRFGSTTAGEATYFKDMSEVLVFKERPVGTVTYEMVAEGNGTATTKVFFGTKSGGRGISGCVFTAAGASKYKITATDTNITELGLYGCVVIDADTISLPAYSDNKEVLSCNFEKCAEVLADTCIVQYCNFILADDRGVRMSSTSHNITDSNFINCGHGVHVSAGTTPYEYHFDNLAFSGCTYDVENSTDYDITILNENGSNASSAENTGAGSTTFETPVYLTVWVEDEAGNPVELAQTAIYAIYDSTQTQLMNKDTDVTGKAQEIYNYTGDETITVRIRKSSGTSARGGFPYTFPIAFVKYFSYKTSGTITSGGYTLTAVLIADPFA